MIAISTELIEVMIKRNELAIWRMEESQDEHVQTAVAQLREETEHMRAWLTTRAEGCSD